MIRKMGIEWHLRLRMAERGMFATTDLVPLLAERGIHLSREQVYRLVTNTPQRLSTDVLAALCDILDCAPNDLIAVVVVNAMAKKTGTHGRRSTRTGDSSGAAVTGVTDPVRTTIRRPNLSPETNP